MKILMQLLPLFMFAIMQTETVELPKVKKELSKDNVPSVRSEKGEYFGVASYYGEKWNGRTTANMEIYDCNKLTCASPSLPFNTIIEVTNISNNKKIKVRVNDRGPYKMNKKGKVLRPLIPHPKRILDLSKESFRQLAQLDKGVIKIKYRVLGFE